ncbi:MAG TPA: glycosyltransferase family 2 protein [Chloroflexota bacterium]|nr:glycosyltransferase family 2 protein [Chloroflexota bacterium]
MMSATVRELERLLPTTANTNRVAEVSVILPAHDEAGNIEPVTRRALEVLPSTAGRFEVIIVDDGSRDQTGEIADRLASESAFVRVIHHPQNRGYGNAWKTGIEAATYKWIFIMDSDRQFDIADIERLIDEAEGNDIVAGYRIARRDPYYRFLVGSCFNILVKLLFNVHLRDIDCGFKLFRADLLKSMPLESPGALINTEIHAKANMLGARLVEVGITHYPRTVGRQSGTKPKVMLRALLEIIRLRWHLVGFRSGADSEARNRESVSAGPSAD